MSFDWAEYLSIAQSLCGEVVSGPLAGAEANQRAGVSRAYYAAFVLARNRLRDVDGASVPMSGYAHQFVAQQYSTDADPRRRQIGIDLGRLRQDRNKCDYDDTVPGLPTLVRRSLARATQIVIDLGRL